MEQGSERTMRSKETGSRINLKFCTLLLHQLVLAPRCRDRDDSRVFSVDDVSQSALCLLIVEN